ncbi:MAG: hypothetical protein RL385_3144, partial [Pseudomonadota bacterium]
IGHVPVPMQQLQPKDRAFIEQRRTQKAFGLYALPALLVAVIGLWVGLFVWWPTAVHPLAANAKYRQENTEESCMIVRESITAEAAMKSVLVNTNLLLACLLIARGVAAAYTERRYRRMIDELLEAPEAALESPAPPAAPVSPAPPSV